MHALQLQVKAEFTETCPLAASCPVILSFQTGMEAILFNYMCLGVCGLLQLFQWCSNVGFNSQSLSSGIPVWGSFSSDVPVYPATIRNIVRLLIVLDVNLEQIVL